MPPTNFLPEPGGSEAQAAEAAAAKGTSEETSRNIDEILARYPSDDATQVKEVTEPRSTLVPHSPFQSTRAPTRLNLFQHPDAHPYVLDVALMRKYGTEWLTWEPSVLEDRILQDFQTQTISDLNIDKIQAVKTLHLVDTFWSEYLVFVPCAMALSGVHADFRVLQALTVPQAMIAVDIAAKLRSDLTYSLEVRTYLEVVYMHDGMLVPIAPLTELVHLDVSRYDVDTKAIRDAWEAVRAEGKAPSGTTVKNVQLQRMLAAHEVLEENRKQLQDQLETLYHA